MTKCPGLKSWLSQLVLGHQNSWVYFCFTGLSDWLSPGLLNGGVPVLPDYQLKPWLSSVLLALMGFLGPLLPTAWVKQWCDIRVLERRIKGAYSIYWVLQISHPGCCHWLEKQQIKYTRPLLSWDELSLQRPFTYRYLHAPYSSMLLELSFSVENWRSSCVCALL